eukprot:SAG31_NODE_3124_length_4649_cov_3.074066_3_plen_83_part_00
MELSFHDGIANIPSRVEDVLTRGEGDAHECVHSQSPLQESPPPLSQLTQWASMKELRAKRITRKYNSQYYISRYIENIIYHK